jgi:hypothetical protein
MNRIIKGFGKIVKLKIFNNYRLNITNSLSHQDELKVPEGYQILIKKVKDLNEDLNIPNEQQSNFRRTIEFHKDFNVILLLKNTTQLVYHFFFISNSRIYLKEIKKYVTFGTNEVYLSAERTFQLFQNQKMSQIAKYSLYSYLKENHMDTAYILVDSGKIIPNHLYRKLGADLIKKYLSIKIWNKKLDATFRIW